jgi:hypothetical protein
MYCDITEECTHCAAFAASRVKTLHLQRCRVLSNLATNPAGGRIGSEGGEWQTICNTSDALIKHAMHDILL